MTFLKNAWYMIAWSHELADTPMFTRVVLDTPIMLYRDPADGVLRAMHDRCPHRFAPLSRGAIVDGNVRCGYHGLQFNHEGACVRNPFNKAAPSAAKVRTFPVVDKGNCVWVWMGDPALADPADAPMIAHHVDPEQRCVFGVTLTKADYRLVSDNLMDLTHTAFLHPALGGDFYYPKFRSWEEGDAIYSDYVIADIPNFLGDALPAERVTHRDTIRWSAPGTHVLESLTTAADDADIAIHQPSAHILTPETAHTTHYFWSSAQPKDSPISDDELKEILRNAFDREDKPMVEAVQWAMGDADLWDLDPVLIPTDAGTVRVRRKLSALIEREDAGADTEQTAVAAEAR